MTRGKAYALGSSVALLLLLGIVVAAKADDGDDTDKCPDGMMPNPKLAELRAAMQVAGNTEAQISATLAKLPQCVPVTCPDGYHRAPNGDCIKNTPDDPDPGFDPYDPGTDHNCPPGERWSLHDRKCVPACGPGQFWDEAAGECRDKPPGGDIDDILKPVPVPGALYQVKKGDLFFGTKISDGSAGLSICYMALRRAAFEAAKLYGNNLSDQAAWAFVKAHAQTLKHEIHALRPYLDILECSWWNDEIYASWRYAQGKATPSPTGRAISLNPAHAPNLAIMRNGGAPARNVRLGKPSDKGTGSPTIANGSWREYPLLWIPEIDLAKFWESQFHTITAEGVVYDDSSSRAVPPPWIQIRGVDDATGTLTQGTVMGCGVSQKAVG